MRRDLNLFREILLALEGDPPRDARGWPTLAPAGRTEWEISYHVKLMHEARLLHAKETTSQDTPIGEERWQATHPTSQGHDFLDAARDATVWKKALAKVGGAFASVAIPVFVDLLVQLGREQLGLPR